MNLLLSDVVSSGGEMERRGVEEISGAGLRALGRHRDKIYYYESS